MKLSKEYIKSRSEVSQESDCWNWTGAGLDTGLPEHRLTHCRGTAQW